MKKVLLFIILYLSVSSVFSQVEYHAKWSSKVTKISESEAEIQFEAVIDKKWHLYGMYFGDGGPIRLEFKFDKNPNYQLIGKVIEKSNPHKEFDSIFKMNIYYFSGIAVFAQKVKILTDKPFVIKVSASGQTCMDDGQCVQEEKDFQIRIEGYKAGKTEKSEKTDTIGQSSLTKDSTESKKDTTKTNAAIIKSAPNGNSDLSNYDNMSLWAFFLTALLGGVIALLTPCIYPMIPMTVSYFMHSSKNRRKAIMQALVYGFAIILIYVLIGLIIAFVLKDDTFFNWLSTHWVPNVFFFVIFVIFAASFFGMFEIVLPSWLINKTDKQADKGGYVGAFFMAFTLVLVSFSCTAPVAGSILALSMKGQVIKPIIGMLGFSLAFALPFTLFAIFPTALQKLPKSGGWLNSVKVVLGFIELALALKFLSVADQTNHWGILDREIYIALWIVIFSLMGFYLLGKLKFSHDSDMPYLSVPRLVLAILTFTFVVYLIPGMFGAPLKALSGWTPPITTLEFDINKIVRENASTTSTSNMCEEPKYSDKLELPHGLKGYFDYDQAISCARKLKKPLFIDFTGHGCVNCREMEARVWSHPEVLKRLKENFVMVALYVDDKKIDITPYVSKRDGKTKSTLGEKYLDFELTKFEANAQPWYILLDNDEQILVKPKGRDLNVENFIKFLDDAVKEFKKRTN